MSETSRPIRHWPLLSSRTIVVPPQADSRIVRSDTEQSNPGSSIETLLPRLVPADRDCQVAAILAGTLLYGQARNFPAGINTACGLQLQGRVGRNQSVEVGRHPFQDHERGKS